MYDESRDRARDYESWSEPLPPDEPTLDVEPHADEQAMRRMERRAARERGRRRPSSDRIATERRPRESERRSRVVALAVFAAVAVVLIIALVAGAGGGDGGAGAVETVPVKLVPLTPEFLQQDESGDAGGGSGPATHMVAAHWSSL